MTIKKTIETRYSNIVKAYVNSGEEKYLAETSELGRELVKENIPPEEIAELHEKAICRMAEEEPDATLIKTARLISTPLMELLMAYGQAFRKTMEDKTQMMDEINKMNKNLEHLIDERTIQLKDKIDEIEAFSYSVSHDLRAPLRAIGCYSEILIEDYADKIDDKGKGLFKKVWNNAQKMDHLIDDLLALSRLGHKTLLLSDIDMNKLAKKVIDDFKSLVPERKLEFVIHNLPPAYCDKKMMEQVFVNLLSNAIKFTRHKDSGVIEVGFNKEGGNNTYYVRDNGAGFNMKYADNLFGAFKRLHNVEEFDGTGVGLAIVKRIVIRHGGRVRAEGKIDEGATFYFTLSCKAVL